MRNISCCWEWNSTIKLISCGDRDLVSSCIALGVISTCGDGYLLSSCIALGVISTCGDGYLLSCCIALGVISTSEEQELNSLGREVWLTPFRRTVRGVVGASDWFGCVCSGSMFCRGTPKTCNCTAACRRVRSLSLRGPEFKAIV